MTYGKIQFDILKGLLKAFCDLNEDEINGLEKACFDYAITTKRPNGEITYRLMEKAYFLLSTGNPNRQS